MNGYRTAWTSVDFTKWDTLFSFGSSRRQRPAWCLDGLGDIDRWLRVLWGVVGVGQDLSCSQVAVPGLDDVGWRRQRGRLARALWHLVARLPDSEVRERTRRHPAAWIVERSVGAPRRLPDPRKAWRTRVVVRERCYVVPRARTRLVGCSRVPSRVREARIRSPVDGAQVRPAAGSSNRLKLRGEARSLLPSADRRADVAQAQGRCFRSPGTSRMKVWSRSRSTSRAPCSGVGISVVWTQIVTRGEAEPQVLWVQTETFEMAFKLN